MELGELFLNKGPIIKTVIQAAANPDATKIENCCIPGKGENNKNK